jgi:hypothetical protein
VLAAAVVAPAALAWYDAHPRPARPAAVPVAAEHTHPPGAACTTVHTENDDQRNGYYLRAWDAAAMCQNQVHAPLHLAASTGPESPVVATLRTGAAADPSWFLCWTVGKPDAVGNTVYYYTAGDDLAPGYEYRHGWGFVPAPYLAIGPEHGLSGLPECPAVPGR